MYDVPLTLRTYVPSGWKQVQVKQGNKIQTVTADKNNKGTFILYQLQPNNGIAELSAKNI
jgi:hypothetical protein